MNRWRPVLSLLALAATLSTIRAENVVLVAGGGDKADNAPATEIKLTLPFGIDRDPAGNLVLVEMQGGERVRRIDKNGTLTTIAGTGSVGYSGDGGPALAAQFNGMHNLAVHPGGDIYLADTWNNCVRKIDAKTGIVTTVAGMVEKGFGGDGGKATGAKFSGVFCASLDPKGENLYLADLGNRRIRAVNLATGIVKTVAGNGQKGVPADGSVAVEAPLVDPRAVAVDRAGNVYVLERSGHALRVVDPSGKIRTVVGGKGAKGLSGDGGEALAATMSGPKHLCIDLQDNVLIADTDNHVIRRYTPRDGKIVRVAGVGRKGTAGIGGPPLELEMNQPHGVFVPPSGEIYITDSHNNRVLKLTK